MSPSFSWEGKTILVWVTVLHFLCQLQIFYSPQEIFVDHTLPKKQQQFFTREENKPKQYSAKVRWLHVQEPIDSPQKQPPHGHPSHEGEAARPRAAWPVQPSQSSAVSKAAGVQPVRDQTPMHGLSSPPLSLRSSYYQTTSPHPPDQTCSSHDCF